MRRDGAAVLVANVRAKEQLGQAIVICDVCCGRGVVAVVVVWLPSSNEVGFSGVKAAGRSPSNSINQFQSIH
jgi:hypothetical protein